MSAVVELTRELFETRPVGRNLKFGSNVSLLMSSEEAAELTDLMMNLEGVSLAEFVAAFLN